MEHVGLVLISVPLSFPTRNIKSYSNCLCYHSLSHYKVRKKCFEPTVVPLIRRGSGLTKTDLGSQAEN